MNHQARDTRALRRAGLVGLAVGALLVRPAIPLRPHAVGSDIPAARGARRRLAAHGDVVAADGDRLVARFTGRAGLFRFRTVELVTFGPDGVTFEHLDGPFASCRERFRVALRPGGGSMVTHEGTFTLRMGLLGWLIGVTIVRPAFERHVAGQMAELAPPQDDDEEHDVGPGGPASGGPEATGAIRPDEFT